MTERRERQIVTMKHFVFVEKIFVLFCMVFVFSADAHAGQKSTKQAEFVAQICARLQEEARNWKVPEAFLARLIWKESRFNPNAVSPKGAEGIAQFMPGTARLRGLADPFEPNSAISSAASYLSDLRNEFGNWGLAAAAYNAGENRIARWRSGASYLPYETIDYVLSITGFPAEDWNTSDFEQPAFRLSSKHDFLTACKKLPTRYSPFRTAATSARRLPWGVQVAANFSRARAMAIYSRLQRKFSRILSSRKPNLIRKVNLSRGRRPIYNVRVGANSRREGEQLCAQLRRAGGYCVVLKN